MLKKPKRDKIQDMEKEIFLLKELGVQDYEIEYLINLKHKNILQILKFFSGLTPSPAL